MKQIKARLLDGAVNAKIDAICGGTYFGGNPDLAMRRFKLRFFDPEELDRADLQNKIVHGFPVVVILVSFCCFSTFRIGAVLLIPADREIGLKLAVLRLKRIRR